MKRSELQRLINECVREVIAENRALKKKKAISEIKRIMAENSLGKEDLQELFPAYLQKMLSTAFSKFTGGIKVSGYKFKKPENANLPVTAINARVVGDIKGTNPNLTDDEILAIVRIVIDQGQAQSVASRNKFVIANPQIDSSTGPNYIKIMSSVSSTGGTVSGTSQGTGGTAGRTSY